MNCAIAKGTRSIKKALEKNPICRPLEDRIAKGNANANNPVQLKQAQKIQVGGQWLHESHNIVFYRGVFVCLWCGYHAVVMPRKLAQACTRQPSKASRRDLNRLARDLPPHGLDGEWPSWEREGMGLSLRLGSVAMFKSLMSYLPPPSTMDDEDFAWDQDGPRDSASAPEEIAEGNETESNIDFESSSEC